MVQYWRLRVLPLLTTINVVGSHLVGSSEPSTLANMPSACQLRTTTAGPSDIELIWNHDSAEMMSPDDRSIWSRVFMHCVAMLSKYSRQLEVRLWGMNDYEYSFAKAFVCGLESPCGLQRLAIETCGAASSTVAPTNSSDFNPALTLYDIGY